MAQLGKSNGLAKRAHKGASALALTTVLSTGLFLGTSVNAMEMNSGVKISPEGMDLSASFVRFDQVDDDEGGAGGANPLDNAVSSVTGGATTLVETVESTALSSLGGSGAPDLTAIIADVEAVLGQNGGGAGGGAGLPAVPTDPAQIQALVAEAQILLAPVLAGMGGGSMPDLTGLPLDGLPVSDLGSLTSALPLGGAGGGGLPVALPGLEGLDLSALSGGGAGLGGLDGVISPISAGGLPLDGVLGGDVLGGGLPGADVLGGGLDGALDGALGGVTGGLPLVGDLLGQ